MTVTHQLESALNLGVVGIWETCDYWKVIKDKNGKVGSVVDDGDKTHINVYNADGSFSNTVGYDPSTSLVAGVLSAAEGITAQKGDANYKRVNSIMAGTSGLDYVGGKWTPVTSQAIADAKQATDARNQANAGNAFWSGLGQLASSAWTGVTSLFKAPDQKKTPESTTYPETVIKQKLLQDAYGYPDTLCLAADFINAYRVMNGLPDSKVNSVMSDAKGKYLDAQGNVMDAPAWSKALAQASGSPTYLDYVYNKGAMQILSAADFQTSDYSLGVGEYYTPNDPTKTVSHYELVQKNPWMEYNPGQSNYTLLRIRPLQSLKY